MLLPVSNLQISRMPRKRPEPLSQFRRSYVMEREANITALHPFSVFCSRTAPIQNDDASAETCVMALGSYRSQFLLD